MKYSMLLCFATLTTLLLLTSPSIGIVEAHSKAITECSENIVYAQATLVYEGLDSTVDPPMWKEGYDTNGNGQADVSAMSFPGEPEHKEHPVYWIVDRDHDGMTDEVYIDLYGFGRCGDIVKLYDAHKPITEDPDHQPRGGA